MGLFIDNTCSSGFIQRASNRLSANYIKLIIIVTSRKICLTSLKKNCYCVWKVCSASPGFVCMSGSGTVFQKMVFTRSWSKNSLFLLDNGNLKVSGNSSDENNQACHVLTTLWLHPNVAALSVSITVCVSSAEHGAEFRLTLHIFNLWNEATSTSPAVFKVIDYYGWLAKLWPLHTFPWLLWTFVPKSEKCKVTTITGAINRS